jgi:hypothetical protein
VQDRAELRIDQRVNNGSVQTFGEIHWQLSRDSGFDGFGENGLQGRTELAGDCRIDGGLYSLAKLGRQLRLDGCINELGSMTKTECPSEILSFFLRSEWDGLVG